MSNGNEYDDILEGLDLIFGIQKTATDYSINQNQIAQTAEAQGILELNKKVAAQNAANLTVSKELLIGDMEDNELETKLLFGNIQKYGVNVEDWLKVDDKYQTKGPDGANKLLDDLGLELGKNLQVRVKYDQNAQVNLDRMTNRINVQREINDGLQEKVDDITSLWGHLENVGTDLELKGIKTKEDIKAYIYENKETFGIDKGIDFENIDWAKDVNHLARVFLKKRQSDTGVGFYQDPTVAQLKAAGLSTETTTWGRPIEEVADEDVALNLNQDFNSIQKTIGDIKTDFVGDAEIARKYSEFVERLNLDNFMNLKGGEKLWDRGEGPMDLKVELEQIIMSMVNDATETGWWEKTVWDKRSDVPLKENIREVAKLKPMTDDPQTTVDESTMMLSEQPLTRYKGVSNLYDRWIGGGVTAIRTLPSGETEPLTLPKTKIGGAPGIGASGLFNRVYAEDKMIAGESSPKGNAYGTTNEDLLLYKFLTMWKHIDDYAPTPIPDFMK